jgi:hypothetical protein
LQDASWELHTNKMEFVSGVPDIPCYRVMDEAGKVIDKEPEVRIPKQPENENLMFSDG